MIRVLPHSNRSDIEARTQVIGRELLAHADNQRPRLWQRAWWDEKLMQFSMRDPQVKVQLFRFIDVLPMLHTPASIMRHLREYLDPVRERLPFLGRWGLSLASNIPPLGQAAAAIVRHGSLAQARRFIAGSNVDEVLATAERERKLGRTFTLDLLGEAVTSDAEAEAYQASYQKMLDELCPRVNAWPEVPQLDRDSRGPLPRVNVSIKLSALDSRFDGIDQAGTLERVGARLRPLLRTAMRHRAHLHLDMESYAAKDLTLRIARTIFMEPEFRDYPHFGVVIQCYLRDAEQDLRELQAWAVERGTPLWVRLVKGAYWDYETIYAGLQDWPIPVWTRKWESDACYERATRYMFEHPAAFRVALASHNIRSLAQGIATAEGFGVDPRDYEIQMLYGMADAEKQALVERGLRLRIYMPFGELIPGMAYLVRRLLENTSNDSFLAAGLSSKPPAEVLLRDPAMNERTTLQAVKVSDSAKETSNSMMTATAPQKMNAPEQRPFVNEPLWDFAKATSREAMQAALAQVRGKLGATYPLVIGGLRIVAAENLPRYNPSQTGELIGRVANASPTQVEQAVRAAKEAQPAWAALGWERRAALLRATAEQMRMHRAELCAWQILECGKPWREADGDVAEAIDFCEYYASGAARLADAGGIDLPGEGNRLEYHPLGVVGVIAPWNFPLAILTGMTAAALVTGNTVVMKPAEQSAVMAAKLMDVFEAAGLPPGVVNFLPGTGEVVGAGLVEHRDVALIAFTGSRPVGMAIHRRAAELSGMRGSRVVKRVIAEMGGKNAVIVADDADLDEAVLGVVKSAFGFAGQKCSACSRCVVVGDVYDAFVPRLVAAAKSLTLGPADQPGTTIGPVIDEESLARIKKYIDIGKAEATTALATDSGALAAQGHFVGPHIFTNVAPQSRLAQEEIFGPVLAVIRARDLDEALTIANDTDYALTGGIFSRSPATLERVQREFQVGNLYINRPITGALVARQPFGGYRMSGIGSKAGGPDYLYQFVVPRTITENTLRRGFAPVEEGE